MVTSRKSSEPTKPRRPPATTPEAQENRMISLAMSQAEYELENKIAPATTVVHFLKLATIREQLEREKLVRENKLLEAREGSIVSAARVEVLVDEALRAMRSYTGQEAVE